MNVVPKPALVVERTWEHGTKVYLRWGKNNCSSYSTKTKNIVKINSSQLAYLFFIFNKGVPKHPPLLTLQQVAHSKYRLVQK